MKAILIVSKQSIPCRQYMYDTNETDSKDNHIDQHFHLHFAIVRRLKMKFDRMKDDGEDKCTDS